MRRSLFGLRALLPLLLASCSGKPQPPLSVEGAWVRLAALPDRPGAAYFTIRSGGRGDRLLALSSPEAGRIELHETMAAGAGTASMRPLAGANVPAGGSLAFAPDGRHAMLFDLSPRVRSGGTLPLRFRFASGRRLAADAVVVGAGDPPPPVAR